MNDVETAIEHEKLLLDPAVRADSAALERLLAPDFSEVGQSGKRWSRAEMIAALVGQPGIAAVAAGFEGRTVGGNVVIVEYETTDDRGTVRRTSLWRGTDEGWRVVHHQATPMASAQPGATLPAGLECSAHLVAGEADSAPK